jgi:hypothetical protein
MSSICLHSELCNGVRGFPRKRDWEASATRATFLHNIIGEITRHSHIFGVSITVSNGSSSMDKLFQFKRAWKMRFVD